MSNIIITFLPEGPLTTKTSDQAQMPWVSGFEPLLHVKNWESVSSFSYCLIHPEFYKRSSMILNESINKVVHIIAAFHLK